MTSAAVPSPAESSLLKQAARQIDYYFSEKNYAKDAYLKQVATRSAEHWINLSEILSFNKMRVLMRGNKVEDLVSLIQKQQA